MVEAARGELEAIQLPAIRQAIEEADQETLQMAGFTPEQTLIKTGLARDVMGRTAERAGGRGPQVWTKTREGLEFAVEVVQQVLGSIGALSKWIEAVAELVGVVGSGAKALAAEEGFLRKQLRRFGRRKRKPAEEPAGPAPAGPASAV